jgi:hypothetical protein
MVHIQNITANTLGWLSALTLHAATIPSYIGILTALTDKLPNLEIILFMWAALIFLFARAIILKDQLNIITIGVGFMVQSIIMAFILFK